MIAGSYRNRVTPLPMSDAGATNFERYTAALKWERWTAEEEAAIAAKAQAGDEEARNALVTNFMHFAVVLAKKWQGCGLTLDELAAAGFVGLMKAADNFDPAKGRFSTYAHWWVNNEIDREIMNTTRTVRVPVHIHKSHRAASKQGNRTPWSKHLAPTIDVEDDIAAPQLTVNTPVWDDTRDALERIIARLPVIDRNILYMRFGLRGEKPRTLEQVGQLVGLTRERVRQRQNQAVAGIRNELIRKGVTPDVVFN